MFSRLICQIACLLLLAAATPAAAEGPAPFETKATALYLVEAETGTVLLEKNAGKPFSPASLGKLLTVETAFDAIANGRLSLDQSFPVSEFAWRTGGAPSGTATMFAALKSQVPVADLLRGITVLSANDACLILAEGMAGSEGKFVEAMRARAKALGLSSIIMVNATGLPAAANRASMRDLAELARHLWTTYPKLYGFYATPEFEWNKIRQRNRNTLLAAGIGVDGLATGFAEGEGFSIVSSIERNGTRLFLAMGGLASDKERVEEARRVLEWGLASFEKRQIFAANEVIGAASVYFGASRSVDLVAHEPLEIYVPVNNPERLSASLVYRWPLKAPVAEGQEAGSVRVYSGKRLLREIPLFTRAAIGEGTLRSKAVDALLELALFWW